MQVTVRHREDELFQKNIAQGVTSEIKGTYAERITLPTHRALLKFLDERLIGKQFRDVDELDSALVEWPAYARDQCGLDDLAPEFAEMGAYQGHEAGTEKVISYIACPGGMGGQLWVGLLDGMPEVVPASA